jgi:hypothetical protein
VEEKGMKTNKLIASLIAVSLLSATPAWAAGSDGGASVTILNPAKVELTPVVMKTIEGLPELLPQTKGYTTLEVDEAVKNVVTVALLKKDESIANTTPDGKKLDLRILAIVDVNMITGELLGVSLSGIRANDGTQEAADDVIKAKAAEHFKKLHNQADGEYKLVSVWHTDTYELGKKRRLFTQVNFRAPVAGDASKAHYVEVLVKADGSFKSYKKVTMPVAYDSWYVADIDKRVKPNDVLPDQARINLEKMKQLLPVMNKYPVKKIVAGKDGTAKVYLQKDETNMYPSVYMKFNEDGSFYNLSVNEPGIQPANDQLAKEKAVAFLKTYLGEAASQFQVKEVSREEHTINRQSGSMQWATKKVRFFNEDTSRWMEVEVSSAGDICGFLGPVRENFLP